MALPATGDTGFLTALTKTLTIEKHLEVNTAAAEKIFSRQYFLLRKKEKRIYTDAQVLQLPRVDTTDPHYNEWRIRKNSCKRLLRHLAKKKRPLHILEVGCGNGWLSAQLAAVKNATVTAIDINMEELRQAQRVFGHKQNIRFVKGELAKLPFQGQLFDVIVFAAAVQYFPSVKKILHAALSNLTLQGEVHIMDSVFYKKEEVVPASVRSKEYFTSLHFPQMQDYYFHHHINSLQGFEHTVLYNPHAFISRLLPGRNPFHHIIITGKK